MSTALLLAPALLAFLALWRGRYPGEGGVLKLVHGTRRRRERARRRRVMRRSRQTLPRGGALLAAALAGRAPPAWAVR